MNLDANALLLSLAIGCVGFVCFAYGKRQGRVPQMAAGAILMIYPYFVSHLLPMAAVGVVVLLLMWVAIRFGA